MNMLKQRRDNLFKMINSSILSLRYVFILQSSQAIFQKSVKNNWNWRVWLIAKILTTLLPSVRSTAKEDDTQKSVIAHEINTYKGLFQWVEWNAMSGHIWSIILLKLIDASLLILTLNDA